MLLMCLKLGLCLLIGGYSVVVIVLLMWGCIDGLYVGKSVILVIARLDANGLFRDATFAVNVWMIGFVVLMVVVKLM